MEINDGVIVCGEHQKDELKKLNPSFDDELIASLEWHMSAAYVKQPNEKTTPLLESRDKLASSERNGVQSSQNK